MQSIRTILDECEIFEIVGGERGKLPKRLKIALISLQSLASKEHRDGTASKALDVIQEAA